MNSNDTNNVSFEFKEFNVRIRFRFPSLAITPDGKGVRNLDITSITKQVSELKTFLSVVNKEMKTEDLTDYRIWQDMVPDFQVAAYIVENLAEQIFGEMIDNQDKRLKRNYKTPIKKTKKQS